MAFHYIFSIISFLSQKFKINEEKPYQESLRTLVALMPVAKPLLQHLKVQTLASVKEQVQKAASAISMMVK